MVKAFSFSVYGSDDKYCKGIIKNLECIQTSFPLWEVWIYVGDGVPESVIDNINTFNFTKIIYTGQIGHENKAYRFFTIDDPTVDIAIIRDADSRIYERDVECIKDFIQSTKLFHIIRDHPNHHTWKIMGGMWGIKKGLIDNIKSLFLAWKSTKNLGFFDDQIFLSEIIYPIIKTSVLVQEAFSTSFEPHDCKLKFKTPLVDLHFIGQVYEYNIDGEEYPKFDYWSYLKNTAN